MGLFSRIASLIRGFFGLFVEDLEKANPDALFADAKNQIEKARKEAEEQIIEIQTNAEMIKIELKTAEKNLQAVKSRMEAAKNQGEKDILVELLMQEEELQATYDTHKATYDNAMEEVTRIREDFKIFESEMSQKLNDIRALKSQAKMAQLKENINSINAKYVGKGNKMGQINEQLDRAREIVNKKTARANAISSLNADNTEIKMKKLDLDSARERAKARAEALLSGSEGFEVKEKNGNFEVKEKNEALEVKERNENKANTR